MSKPTVYLAGPIRGLTHADSTFWRRHVTRLLEPDIVSLSPMRNKEHLTGQGLLTSSYPDDPMCYARGIVTRDFNDVCRCDLVLANLYGATQASIGTVLEIAWAYAFRTPTVLVIENEGNPCDHSMLRELAGFIVDDLNEAVKITRNVLLP